MRRHIPQAIGWLVLAGVFLAVAGPPFILLAAVVAAATYLMALLLQVSITRRQRGPLTTVLLVAAVSAHLILFVSLALMGSPRTLAPFGHGVMMCLAVAYLIDVHRGNAETNSPVTAAYYLAQFPVLLAGPVTRYREFAIQFSQGNVTLGAFAYGVRRITTGLVKAVVVGGTLEATADIIFGRPAATLSASAAWLGACCGALQIYLQFSGCSDIAIGVGRTMGFRYPENFRRPYTADSIREFWRRWNITLMTWLRDFLYLPGAGVDHSRPRLYLDIVAGFSLVGLWHGGGGMFLIWGIYCATWLALEANGLDVRIERWPAPVRHAYVLVVVTVGWVILRAPDPAAAFGLLKAMAGLNAGAGFSAVRDLTPALLGALAAGVFAAGPPVPSISRWRVSVDAAATSLLMMAAATGLFLWRGPSLLLHSIWPSRAAVVKPEP